MFPHPPEFIDRLILGDCAQVLTDLPREIIPLTVTSPPYDGLRDYSGAPFVFEPIAQELFRVTMPGGVLVWVVRDQIVDGSETGTSSRQKLYFLDLGFRCFQTITINKHHPGKSPRYGFPPELAFVFSKGAPRVVNLIADIKNKLAGQAYRYNYRRTDGTLVYKRRLVVTPPCRVRGPIWDYNAGSCHTTTDTFTRDHPARMLEKLAEDLIFSFSRPGDLVLDPLAGSGTTLKMAMLMNRHYLGIELHNPYYQMAQRRIENAEREHRLRLDELIMEFPPATAERPTNLRVGSGPETVSIEATGEDRNRRSIEGAINAAGRRLARLLEEGGIIIGRVEDTKPTEALGVGCEGAIDE